MLNNDKFESARSQTVQIAERVISGSLNVIEGVRMLNSIRFKLDDPEDEVFVPIRAFDSETDHIPLGDIRDNFPGDYLKNMDDELKLYLVNARKDILAACARIIERFS